MSQRGRKQRLDLQTSSTHHQLDPIETGSESISNTLESEFALFVADIDHIKSCNSLEFLENKSIELLGPVNEVPGWVTLRDTFTDSIYFWHTSTGKVSWHRPQFKKSPSPPPPLPIANPPSPLVPLDTEHDDKEKEKRIDDQNKDDAEVPKRRREDINRSELPTEVERVPHQRSVPSNDAFDDDYDMEISSDEHHHEDKIDKTHHLPEEHQTVALENINTTAPPQQEQPLKTKETRRRSSRTRYPNRKRTKNAVSLMNKWNAKRKELYGDHTGSEDIAEDDGILLAEAEERRKMLQVEEWRLEQLHSASVVQENPNFVPVGVLGNNTTAVMNTTPLSAVITAAEANEQENAEVALPSCSSPPPSVDVHELSIGLADGWLAMWDDAYKMVYYANLITKQTQWERPE